MSESASESRGHTERLYAPPTLRARRSRAQPLPVIPAPDAPPTLAPPRRPPSPQAPAHYPERSTPCRRVHRKPPPLHHQRHPRHPNPEIRPRSHRHPLAPPRCRHHLIRSIPRLTRPHFPRHRFQRQPHIPSLHARGHRSRHAAIRRRIQRHPHAACDPRCLRRIHRRQRIIRPSGRLRARPWPRRELAARGLEQSRGRPIPTRLEERNPARQRHVERRADEQPHASRPHNAPVARSSHRAAPSLQL